MPVFRGADFQAPPSSARLGVDFGALGEAPLSWLLLAIGVAIHQGPHLVARLGACPEGATFHKRAMALAIHHGSHLAPNRVSTLLC